MLRGPFYVILRGPFYVILRGPFTVMLREAQYPEGVARPRVWFLRYAQNDEEPPRYPGVRSRQHVMLREAQYPEGVARPRVWFLRCAQNDEEPPQYPGSLRAPRHVAGVSVTARFDGSVKSMCACARVVNAKYECLSDACTSMRT